MSDETKGESPAKSRPDIETRDGVREALTRAGKGDRSMLPLVRKIFARDSSYLEAYGNTFIHACNAMVKYAAGNDLAVEEAVRRKIESLQEEVASPNPSPLERILSERIALRRTVP